MTEWTLLARLLSLSYSEVEEGCAKSTQLRFHDQFVLQDSERSGVRVGRLLERHRYESQWALQAVKRIYKHLLCWRVGGS